MVEERNIYYGRGDRREEGERVEGREQEGECVREIGERCSNCPKGLTPPKSESLNAQNTPSYYVYHCTFNFRASRVVNDVKKAQ